MSVEVFRLQLLTPCPPETLTHKAQETLGVKSKEAEGKAKELAGEAKGKAHELEGKAKGKAEELRRGQ